MNAGNAFEGRQKDASGRVVSARRVSPEDVSLSTGAESLRVHGNAFNERRCAADPSRIGEVLFANPAGMSWEELLRRVRALDTIDEILGDVVVWYKARCEVHGNYETTTLGAPCMACGGPVAPRKSCKGPG